MSQIKLVLESGDSFEGTSFGHELTDKDDCLGEVVFNTGMMGYQEIISDPSYCDQIIVMTYPTIGNYGVSRDDFESLTPALKAFVVKEYCDTPSNFRSVKSLDVLLKEFKIPGIQGVDTRQLTRLLRSSGAMKGVIVPSSMPTSEAQNLAKRKFPTDQIQKVSMKQAIHYPGPGKRIVLVDYGFKKSILTSLMNRGCDVVVVPWNFSFEQISRYNPDGVLLSNGPGDPKEIVSVAKTIAKIQEKFPLFCICMGHQVFALANGADTEKLKFGHRGCNHPVKDLKKDKTFMTSQNHGYAVKTESIAKTDLEITQINLNDGTVEGLKHKKYKAFSVQYHPEANPGPEDTAWLFEDFLHMIDQGGARA